LQTGVKITRRLKVKQFAHFGTAFVLEGGALNDGNLAGLAVAGGVTALHAFGFYLVIFVAHGKISLSGFLFGLRDD
jgi:hypothetical protein